MLETGISWEKGLINRGNCEDIKKCMRRAQAGDKICVGFLGGSITQGSLSSVPETCYAYLVYKWFRERFPEAKVTYRNAGIGGTTSQYGVSRVQEHLLQYQPDFVLTEFAVNDENTEFYKETYEGLVRLILKEKKRPALLLMNNVRYDDGTNAQDMHLQVARHYDVPMVSMKETIWPAVEQGKITRREITPDDLHPNDAGHALVAKGITTFLEQILSQVQEREPERPEQLPRPLTRNRYEESIRYQNGNSHPVTEGFRADRQPQTVITDIFRNGWVAEREKDRITFEIAGTGIAIQYRKSVRKPAPVAKVWIDGQEEKAILLDSNFQEDWGDCLYIQTIAQDLKDSVHRVEIEVIQASEEDAAPFYLVSVIGSR
jgi:lysophospholipase L1-like esterase